MIRFPLQHRIRQGLRGTFLRELAVAHRHRGMGPDDVLLAAFPKSGSTWLTFMLAQLIWRAGREQKLIDNRYLPEVGRQHQAERRLPSGGRLIRTHEAYRPDYRRAIYMVRDGRDVAVSMYWHLQRSNGMQADFSDFLFAYLRGRLHGAGPWQDHIHGWLDSRAAQEGRVLLLRYEDLKADTAGELKRASEFLGVEASSDSLAEAIELGSLKAMREREQQSQGIAHYELGETIPVVRKGIVGDWLNHFSNADLQRFYEICGSAMARVGYVMEPVTGRS